MAAITILISGILAILFGITVIVWKKSLNYLVGVWMILNGILQIIA